MSVPLGWEGHRFDPSNLHQKVPITWDSLYCPHVGQPFDGAQGSPNVEFYAVFIVSMSGNPSTEFLGNPGFEVCFFSLIKNRLQHFAG